MAKKKVKRHHSPETRARISRALKKHHRLAKAGKKKPFDPWPKSRKRKGTKMVQVGKTLFRPELKRKQSRRLG